MWIKHGDSIVLSIAPYSFSRILVRLKDIFSGNSQLYVQPSSSYRHPDYKLAITRSLDPTKYAKFYYYLLNASHSDVEQTLRIIVDYYRHRIQCLNSEIYSKNKIIQQNGDINAQMNKYVSNIDNN